MIATLVLVGGLLLISEANGSARTYTQNNYSYLYLIRCLLLYKLLFYYYDQTLTTAVGGRLNG